MDTVLPAAVNSETFLNPAFCSYKDGDDEFVKSQNADRERMVCAVALDMHFELDVPSNEGGLDEKRLQPFNPARHSPACGYNHTGKIPKEEVFRKYYRDPIALAREIEKTEPYDPPLYAIRDPRLVTKTEVIRDFGCKVPIDIANSQRLAEAVLNYYPDKYVYFLNMFVSNLFGDGMKKFLALQIDGYRKMLDNPSELNRLSWGAFTSVRGREDEIGMPGIRQRDVSLRMDSAIREELNKLALNGTGMTSNVNARDLFDLKPCIDQHIETLRKMHDEWCRGYATKEHHALTMMYYANESGRRLCWDRRLLMNQDTPDYDLIRLIVPATLHEEGPSSETLASISEPDKLSSIFKRLTSDEKECEQIQTFAYSVGRWSGSEDTTNVFLQSTTHAPFMWGWGHPCNLMQHVRNTTSGDTAAGTGKGGGNWLNPTTQRRSRANVGNDIIDGFTNLNGFADNRKNKFATDRHVRYILAPYIHYGVGGSNSYGHYEQEPKYAPGKSFYHWDKANNGTALVGKSIVETDYLINLRTQHMKTSKMFVNKWRELWRSQGQKTTAFGDQPQDENNNRSGIVEKGHAIQKKGLRSTLLEVGPDIQRGEGAFYYRGESPESKFRSVQTLPNPSVAAQSSQDPFASVTQGGRVVTVLGDANLPNSLSPTPEIRERTSVGKDEVICNSIGGIEIFHRNFLVAGTLHDPYLNGGPCFDLTDEQGFVMPAEKMSLYKLADFVNNPVSSKLIAFATQILLQGAAPYMDPASSDMSVRRMVDLATKYGIKPSANAVFIQPTGVMGKKNLAEVRFHDSILSQPHDRSCTSMAKQVQDMVDIFEDKSGVSINNSSLLLRTLLSTLELENIDIPFRIIAKGLFSPQTQFAGSEESPGGSVLSLVMNASSSPSMVLDYVSLDTGFTHKRGQKIQVDCSDCESDDITKLNMKLVSFRKCIQYSLGPFMGYVICRDPLYLTRPFSEFKKEWDLAKKRSPVSGRWEINWESYIDLLEIRCGIVTQMSIIALIENGKRPAILGIPPSGFIDYDLLETYIDEDVTPFRGGVPGIPAGGTLDQANDQMNQMRLRLAGISNIYRANHIRNGVVIPNYEYFHGAGGGPGGIGPDAPDDDYDLPADVNKFISTEVPWCEKSSPFDKQFKHRVLNTVNAVIAKNGLQTKRAILANIGDYAEAIADLIRASPFFKENDDAQGSLAANINTELSVLGVFPNFGGFKFKISMPHSSFKRNQYQTVSAAGFATVSSGRIPPAGAPPLEHDDMIHIQGQFNYYNTAKFPEDGYLAKHDSLSTGGAFAGWESILRILPDSFDFVKTSPTHPRPNLFARPPVPEKDKAGEWVFNSLSTAQVFKYNLFRFELNGVRESPKRNEMLLEFMLHTMKKRMKKCLPIEEEEDDERFKTSLYEEIAKACQDYPFLISSGDSAAELCEVGRMTFRIEAGNFPYESGVLENLTSVFEARRRLCAFFSSKTDSDFSAEMMSLIFSGVGIPTDPSMMYYASIQSYAKAFNTVSGTQKLDSDVDNLLPFAGYEMVIATPNIVASATDFPAEFDLTEYRKMSRRMLPVVINEDGNLFVGDFLPPNFMTNFAQGNIPGGGVQQLPFQLATGGAFKKLCESTYDFLMNKDTGVLRKNVHLIRLIKNFGDITMMFRGSEVEETPYRAAPFIGLVPRTKDLQPALMGGTANPGQVIEGPLPNAKAIMGQTANVDFTEWRCATSTTYVTNEELSFIPFRTVTQAEAAALKSQFIGRYNSAATSYRHAYDYLNAARNGAVAAPPPAGVGVSDGAQQPIDTRAQLFSMLDAAAILWGRRCFFNAADSHRPSYPEEGDSGDMHPWCETLVESFLASRQRFLRENPKEFWEVSVHNDPERAFSAKKFIGAMTDDTFSRLFPLITADHKIRDCLQSVRSLGVMWGSLPSYGIGQGDSVTVKAGAWMPLSEAHRVRLLKSVGLFDMKHQVPSNPWLPRNGEGLCTVFNQSYHSVYPVDNVSSSHFREWVKDVCRYQPPSFTVDSTKYPFSEYGGTPVEADFLYHRVEQPVDDSDDYIPKRHAQLVYNRFGFTKPMRLGQQYNDTGLLQDLYSYEYRNSIRLTREQKTRKTDTIYPSNFMAYARNHVIIALASCNHGTPNVSESRVVRNLYRLFVDAYEVCSGAPSDNDLVPVVMGFIPSLVRNKSDRPMTMFAGSLPCLNAKLERFCFSASNKGERICQNYKQTYLNDAALLFMRLVRANRRRMLHKANYFRVSARRGGKYSLSRFYEELVDIQDAYIEFLQTTLLSMCIEQDVDMRNLPLHLLEPRQVTVPSHAEDTDVVGNDFLGPRTLDILSDLKLDGDNISRTQLAILGLMPPNHRILGTFRLNHQTEIVDLEHVRKQIQKQAIAGNKKVWHDHLHKVIRASLASRFLEEHGPIDHSFDESAFRDPLAESAKIGREYTATNAQRQSSVSQNQRAYALRENNGSSSIRRMTDDEYWTALETVREMVKRDYDKARGAKNHLQCLLDLNVPDHVKDRLKSEFSRSMAY